MAIITNADIVNYIFDNRLSDEDRRYLLESRASKGNDAIAQSSLWLRSRFYKNGQGDLFDDFRSYLYQLTALTDMASIEIAFQALDSTNYLEYMMIFEAFINMSMYQLYYVNEQEAKALDKKQHAQDIIEGIIGTSAFPNSAQGGGSSSGMFAVVDAPSDQDMEDEAFGLQAGWRRSTDSSTDE